MSKAISIKVTGLQELKRDFKKVMNDKLPSIIGEEYVKLVKKNLVSSKDTGNLYKSIKFKVKAKDIQLYSRLAYANIQNYGGTIRITAQMRKKMWALFADTGNTLYRNIAISKKDSIIIPAKNYTTIDKRLLNRNINRRLQLALNRI